MFYSPASLCVVYLLLFVFCEADLLDKIMIVTATNSDDTLPTPQLITHFGYPCEIHSVITEDGYILGVHRIPGNTTHGIDKKLYPIILQHGLMDSSADFVLSGPQKGLAFMLADRGYDVWLGNARGNEYSRAHTTLSPEDDKFWEFSWHEMGTYDIPALIDYILNKTKHEQVLYTGHSMGTTMFFVMSSTRPDYNKKIAYMAALAPVAYLGHTESPIKFLAPIADDLEKITDIFGHGELYLSYYGRRLLKIACEITTLQEEVCENILFLIVGFDNDQLDLSILPLILGHNPAGTSSKTLVHYAQLIKSNKFCQFDYGEAKNLEMYNSILPPDYNLSLVNVPLSLHYALNDLLATPTDVKHLFKNLPDKVKLIQINYEKFNHLDFLWGRNAPTLVYDMLFQLLSIRKQQIPMNFLVSVISLEQDKNISDIRILLEEKSEPAEKKAEAKPAPKKEEVKTEAKSESKTVEAKGASSKAMFDGIIKQLPVWQNAIVEKLVTVQQLIVKKLGSKGK